MKKPTAEQLNDLQWWNKTAGTASHYCLEQRQFYDFLLHHRDCCFDRPKEPESVSDSCLSAHIGEIGNQVHNLGCEFQNNENLSERLGAIACDLWDLAKKAPKEPAEPEWNGQGLPPVGTVCECLFNDGWCKVTVLAAYGTELWVSRPRGTHVVSTGLKKFRPIRTPEQIQRDDLKELVRTAYNEGAAGHVGGLAAIVTELIAGGYHK